ncbi:MAG: glycoside hydrolase [Euryarchaeota archaeon]|nr:glycoside hydrolase [Euryarchaeota archaeon]
MRASRLSLLALFVLTPVLAGCIADEPAETATVLPVPWERSFEQRTTPGDVGASEVAIAGNPLDPEHLVSAANSGGGYAVHVTRDGGTAWTASRFEAAWVDPLPNGAGRFRGLSDPVVAFGPDGALYLAGLAYIPTSAVFVAKSLDGGATWSEVVVTHESDLGTSFNDKEWLGANPTSGTLVLTWQKEPAMDQLRGVEAALGNPADIDIGDIVVSRSTDGGTSWTEPQVVSRGRHNNGTQVAFTPDGRAHLLWLNYETGTLDHIVSTDDGVTWSDPKAVADVEIVPPFARYGRMHTLPGFTADPGSDALYAVWHDRRNGDADVYAIASPDGGETWREPVRVNQDDVGNGAVQFYPWAAVDPDGRLHVTFYDSRHDDHPRFHFYHAYAEGPELDFIETGNVTSQDFTVFVAPDGSTGEQRGIGDYTGIAATTSGVFPAWADGRDEKVGVWSVRLALP